MMDQFPNIHIQWRQQRKRSRCTRTPHHSSRYYITPLLSILPILNIIININSVTSQQIQGYIYWDSDSNGILDTSSSGSGSGVGDSEYVSELENGLIDVEVVVRPCYNINGDGDGEDEDGKFNFVCGCTIPSLPCLSYQRPS